jgi:hypothetical protein
VLVGAGRSRLPAPTSKGWRRFGLQGATSDVPSIAPFAPQRTALPYPMLGYPVPTASPWRARNAAAQATETAHAMPTSHNAHYAGNSRKKMGTLLIRP